MRFLINVIDSETGSATTGEMAHINAFNAQLREHGNWVMACGVYGPSTSTVIDNRNDAGLATDGPLITSDEYISGFWIIDVDSHEMAARLAAEGSRACNRRVELRQLHG